MRKFLYFLIFMGALQAENVYAIFNVVPTQDANLTLDSGGTIALANVDVGSEVKKGDILLVLSNKDKEANLKIQQAQSQAVEQQYLFAKKQYERYKKSKGAVDRNTLDKYYFDFKNLESSFLQSKHNVDYQREILNKTILTAPFDGIIASKEVEVGDGVTANSTILFRLISKEIKLVLEFDVKYIDFVKEGSEFEFSSEDGKSKRVVRISKVYPTADEKTRKVKAEAIATGLIPGTFGDGYIRTK
ncbi:efflux RND transporter periplasmic adaptor subunit [Helicobacter cholecystus]|uniref:Efflux RND transporter periplasmic adaptor subunit n=1 Tax=Helicobacter cholecystus TaxID=45498 RepID=A0A3D8IW51_9HELI|nr:efflux RND transporter periplasmic adaptor subunit [Helicobacter cholecystus]RDU69507.1 efflux RND transporter periplasmic adaptor subunit [Helicobacter cholecystus]VEJ24060.1 membrane fusion protein of the hefABC efflux system HefB [Helicobacter cholecystus]